ncbi:Alpha/beta hydrolase family protein [compost metagenome]
MEIFNAKVSHAAWKTKPSWAIIATQDKAIDPKLLRHTADRIGAKRSEVVASHVLFLTQPKAVADTIDAAARSIAR